jgi:uncharacterized protein (TIGR02246 family)
MNRVTIAAAYLTFFAFALLPSTTQAQASYDRVTEYEKVKAVVDRFGRMWEDEDMEAFANVVAQDADIIIIGTDSAEVWLGYEAYRDARERQYASFENVEFNVYDQKIRLSESGTVAWFSETFDLVTIAQGNPVSLEGIRLTGVLEKRRGYWRVVQLHNSVPVLGQAAEY